LKYSILFLEKLILNKTRGTNQTNENSLEEGKKYYFYINYLIEDFKNEDDENNNNTISNFNTLNNERK